MPEKLKDLFFTKETINYFADRISTEYLGFSKNKFIKSVFENNWDLLELKAKMRHLSVCLHNFLPTDFEKAVHILIQIAPHIKGFEGMILPDYVEIYGQDHWDISLEALKEFTKYSSSEFAIRPFIIKDTQKTMKYMLNLANHENEHVRRFASEGCRPRLPWAMALPEFKKDPSLIIPILERLKNDKSEYVRKSVANNLNDISKDNPNLVLELCNKWKGKSERTDWIIKHACRTLLKAGDKRAMILFGYEDPSHVKILYFEINPREVKIGDYLKFTFVLHAQGKSEVKLRIEYAIDYLKLNNSYNRKVFKINENTYHPGAYTFNKKHSFKEMTTRKHYPGKHKLLLIINGEIKDKQSFQVKSNA